MYYGNQTRLAMGNFGISGQTIVEIPFFVPILIQIKKAAVWSNWQLGELDGEIASAIIQAADEIIANTNPDEFAIDIYQGGGGTSSNMNVNEVLANRANEIVTGQKGYDKIHPNDHVNKGQSTNDVIPTALKLTIYHCLKDLEKKVAQTISVIQKKEREFQSIVKLSRTCLQDALPITFGQYLSGYVASLKRQLKQIKVVREECLFVPLGATAVGTGLGANSKYKDKVLRVLGKQLKVKLQTEENLFDALQNADFWIMVSATLKSLASILHKISSDLRLLSSGPRSGFMEIRLPEVQAGSSIMPGKVNPAIPEMMMQVYFRVLGNDTSVSRACEGELDLNIWEMILLHTLTESINLLTKALPLFNEKCLKGLTVNENRCRQNVENSPALATVISLLSSYSQATKLVEEASKKNQTIKEASIASGFFTPKEADELLCPHLLTDPKKLEKLIKSKKLKKNKGKR